MLAMMMVMMMMACFLFVATNAFYLSEESRRSLDARNPPHPNEILGNTVSDDAIFWMIYVFDVLFGLIQERNS